MVELGQRALAGAPLDDLIGEAVESAARELGTDYASVLELTGDGRALLVRGGHGLPDGVLGGALYAGEEELPGFALHAEGPVVIDDFATETRFGASALQRDLAIVSAMAAPIGSRERLFGVLGANSRTPQHFSADDANFLQALANVLGAAAERARHEELVGDSEARFRELADTTPALMWMTDAEGDVTFVNEGWLRFTGRTLAEELGDTFGMCAHPDDRAEMLAEWRAAVARRAEFRFEYRLTNSRGGHSWVLEVGTPRFAEGEFVGYVGTATDIDERKGMEDALRESEASFRQLANSAPAMIWTTDDAGLVTFVNEGWLRYTGTTLEEELGHRWTRGVHTEDAPAVLGHLERAACQARAVGTRVPPARPGGRLPLDRRPWRSTLRGRALRRVRGHGDRHPRTQDRGGPPARGLRARAHDRGNASAQPSARAAAAHRGPGDRRALPAGRARNRDRGRLVRRARAPRRPGGARGR